MVFYEDDAGLIFTSSSTPNTALGAQYMKPGATRSLFIRKLTCGGADTARTNLNALIYQLIVWSSTATVINTGTSITPAPQDPGMQAAKHTAGACTGQGGTALTNGTGGPLLKGKTTSSLTGAGYWQEQNIDASPLVEGGATMSADIRVTSPIASALCSVSASTAE